MAAKANDPAGPLTVRDDGQGVYSITLDLAEKTGAAEADILHLDHDRLMLVYGADNRAGARFSNDLGRTWGPRVTLRTESGEPFAMLGTISVKRLRSGRLMLLHRDERRADGDVPMRFRTSSDEGLTFSAGCVVNPQWEIFAVHNGSAVVLKNGRILLPGMTWFRMNERRKVDWSRGGWDYMMCYTHIYYSDDEGKSWCPGRSQLNACIDRGRRGLFPFEEPSVAELSDGELFMAGRTNLGRLFESRSKDAGESWLWPEPLPLASAYAPPAVRAVPGTDQLLMVWNQTSPWEQQHGLRRHRLSVAISADRGKTWGHFRNLESLDDRTRIEPPPLDVATDSESPFAQPQNTDQYPHAPGPLRCTYPAMAFAKDRVAFVYDYMVVGPDGRQLGNTVKVKVVPLAWIYGATP